MIGGSLQTRKLTFFFGLNKQDRIALTAGSSSSSNSVNVSFGVVWEVVVDDVTNALNVQTTRGDVRGDHDVDFPRHQLANRSLALVLSDITVECRSNDASLD